jgi:predicted nucleic acid-binding protein
MVTGSRFNFANNSEEFPPSIVVDTSVLLHLIKPRPVDPKERRLHNDAKVFFERAKKAILKNEVECYVPMHVVTESFRWIVVNQTRQITNTISYEDLKRRIKADPDLLRKADVISNIQSFLIAVDDIELTIVQPEDFLNDTLGAPTEPFEDKIIEFIEDLLLLPDDAHILAVADFLDINNIASLDRDFLAVVNKGFNVYTSQHI